MIFSSVEECISYIENCIEKCMSELSEELKRVLEEESYRQIHGWGGYLHKSIRSSSEGMSAEAYFSNEGKWYSLVTGSPVNNPISFNEAGTVWGKGSTNIIDVALGRAEDEMPQKFLQLMRGMGIPIQG